MSKFNLNKFIKKAYYEDGKKIEFEDSKGKWVHDNKPDFSWDSFQYRIAEEKHKLKKDPYVGKQVIPKDNYQIAHLITSYSPFGNSFSSKMMYFIEGVGLRSLKDIKSEFYIEGEDF